MKFDFTSGIYCIENKENNKKYIGQSVDLKKRIREHKYLLKNNIHENTHLQSSWNKYGESSFSFYILEYCNIEELNKKEEYRINNLNLINPSFGYNKCGGGNSKSIISDETRGKLRKANIGKTHSDITKQKLREINLGKVLSVETKEKMSKSRSGENHFNYGKHPSEQTLAKMKNSHVGLLSGMINKNHTEESKTKMSVSKKGKPWSENRRIAQLKKQGGSIHV